MSLREKITEIKKIVFKPLPEIPKELTFRDKISKDSYLNLKLYNKLYSGSAKAIRESAIRNNGLVRGHLRYLKDVEGQKARVYHVALCFLRGKKYSEVEPNVEDKNKLTVNEIYKILAYSVNRSYQVYLKYDIEKFLGE